MKLSQRFITAVYKFDKYNELINTTVGSSLAYYFLISILTVVIMSAAVFPAVSEIYSSISQNVPEFEITDGKLTAEDTVDINAGGTVVKVDSSVDDIEELVNAEDYVQGIFISSSELIVDSKLSNIYNRTSLETFEGLDNSSLKAALVFLKYLTYMLAFVFLMLSKVVFLLFVWCVAKLMSNLFRGGLGFKDSLKLGIYASTTASIIKSVLLVFAVSMHNIIFYGIIIAYMYFGLESCKKQEVKVENNLG